MRRLFTIVAALAALLVTAAPALACGGLIGPNGAVNLLRTTTFAGYHDGVEHYVTAFQFAGGGGAFGSIVPLPDVPTSVERGGDWTLQRLVRETDPPQFRLEAAAAAGDAEVLLQTRIDALDITILRGGGAEVGKWATEHGFRLPPDAPEVLDFYADRSPIFMAASFDADAARERGQQVGDGTPVHLLPQPADNGLTLDHSAAATDSLLADLRSDKGMGWIPASAWLSKVEINADAAQLKFDLAIDPTGTGAPSMVDAGLAGSGPPPSLPTGNLLVLWLLVAVGIAIPTASGLALALRPR